MDQKRLLRQAIVLFGVLLGSPGVSAHDVVCVLPLPSLTLSESVSQVDTVCLAQRVSSPAPDQDGFRDVSLEIVDILKCLPRTVRKGDHVNFRLSREADKNGLFLILGVQNTNGPGIEWKAPVETTRACFDYIAHAPAVAEKPRKRLPYFLQFVDTPDPCIRADIALELDEARFEDLLVVAPAMPRDKFRKMLADPKMPDKRLALPGFLLGLCGTGSFGTGSFGTGEDVKLLAAKITEKSQSADGFREGTDSMMMGYLMLAGESGLDNLDKWKLKDPSAPFTETYSAMLALRFMWNKANGRIRRERLIQSMRLVLDRTDLADLAIADLGRWRDWNSIDRIAALYGQGHSNLRFIKRAIIRYLWSCTNARPTDVRPEQVTSAKRHLEELRKKEPQFVADVERRMAEMPD